MLRVCCPHAFAGPERVGVGGWTAGPLYDMLRGAVVVLLPRSPTNITPSYLSQPHMKPTSALEFSSDQTGSFGLGNTKCPLRRPGTTTFGGGRCICMDAFRLH